jgi:hypothetical protein
VALTLPVQTSEVIGLDDYLEHVRATVDVRDLDSAIASAPQLAALANHRSFLAEHLCAGLAQWESFQAGNEYISQSFILGRGPGWFVRANVWTPRAESDEVRSTQDRVSFYGVAHDHNFSFLTVGYWGSGYETQIYEVEPGSFEPVEGARAELAFLERTRLTTGKVMLYRAHRDVHEQAPPDDMSISLNLMLVPPEIDVRDQYYFDLRTQRVASVLGIYNDRVILLCKLAGALGGAVSPDLLIGLAERHPAARVRAAALAALADLGDPDAARKLADTSASAAVGRSRR